jgi:hypothetical protein
MNVVEMKERVSDMKMRVEILSNEGKLREWDNTLKYLEEMEVLLEEMYKEEKEVMKLFQAV